MTDEIKSYDELQKRIKELEYDLSVREQIDKTLLFLSQHGWEHPRENFFQSLARFLANTLEMDYVCIDRLKGDLLEAETFAIYFDGKFEDNVSYALKDTPCGDVVGKNICCFPNNVRHLFKNDAVLQDMLAESYVGTTLWNSKNEPIGLIAVIGRQPLKNSYFAETVLKLVAVRASGELERINAENALRQSEYKFSFLYENMPVAINITSLEEGKLIDVNNAFLKMTGFENKDSVIGKTVVDLGLVIEQEKREKIRKNIKEQGFAEEVEMKILVKSGDVKQIKTNAKIITLNQVDYILSTSEDITELKQSEQTLKESELKLKVLNATKDKLFTIISHDLKSPFNTLLGFSELLINNIQNYDIDKIEKYLRQINKIGRNTYNLLIDLLLWSKNQSGQLAFKPQPIVIKNICSEVVDSLKENAEAKRIEILCFETNSPIINADINMIKAILRNLISNAIKFTNENGQIKIYSELDENYVTIVVSDNGVGIDKQNVEKIWDIKQQYTTTGTANETGSGFGLTICKEFVERHGGQIWAESEIGKGSDFKFTIPVRLI